MEELEGKCRRAGRREAKKLGLQLFEDWKGNGSRGWPRFSFTRQKLRAISPLTQKSLANGLHRKHERRRSKEIVNLQIQGRSYIPRSWWLCLLSKKLLNFFSLFCKKKKTSKPRKLNINRDVINSSFIEQIGQRLTCFSVSPY